MKRIVSLLLTLLLLCSCALAEETKPKRYGYKRTTVVIPVAERSVSGVFYLPKNAGDAVPLVIMCHGYTADLTTYTYMADKLARKGIACYALDFYGGSPHSTSGGTMAEMSVDTEQEELDAAIDHFAQAEGIDPARIILLGHSQGGYVCTLEATRHPEKVHALFLYAPALHIAESMTAGFPDRDNVPESTRVGFGAVGRRYVLDVWGEDIYADMPNYPGPVQIFHGDADGSVPVSCSERAVAAFPDAMLTILPGVDHALPDAVADVIISAMDTFLKGE